MKVNCVQSKFNLTIIKKPYPLKNTMGHLLIKFIKQTAKQINKKVQNNWTNIRNEMFPYNWVLPILSSNIIITIIMGCNSSKK